MSVFNLNYELT